MSDVADEEIEGFLRSHGPFEKPPLLACGDRVGEWTIRAFLGRGGSSEVYRAENETTGFVAALKILCRTDDRTRGRFRREARLLAEMRCAAFPKFYGAGNADGRFYIAEEILEPTPLPETDAAVARFILDVAVGVEELHRGGFVHRDIKPRNVMTRPPTGESVLIDMGLAKASDDTPQTMVGGGRARRPAEPPGRAVAPRPPQTGNDTISVVNGHAVGVGTPGFSAPEQFAGGKIGPATDIHALGMLANACFGGKPPRAWTKIIRRSTCSIPEQRYSSVAEFTRAIRRRHAWRWWFAAIAVMAIVVLMASGRAVAPRPPQTTISDGRARRPAEPQAISDGVSPHKENIKSNKILQNEPKTAENIFELGKTRFENGIFVTRISLGGRDISIPGEVTLEGKRKIELIGPGRLTASITGPREASLELSGHAVLINLTATPYPESRMKYVLNGACYLNFKNLDPPADCDYKNIWVDDSNGNGTPSFRFRGPDSYEEVREEDKKFALEAMRKGIPSSY